MKGSLDCFASFNSLGESLKTQVGSVKVIKSKSQWTYLSLKWVTVLKVSSICDVLRDQVPFVQFKKRENNYKGVLLLVVTLFHDCFWLLKNYTKGTKLRKASLLLCGDCFFSSFSKGKWWWNSHQSDQAKRRKFLFAKEGSLSLTFILSRFSATAA